MDNRQLLASHPSVQDLALGSAGVNDRKATIHTYMANAGPLHMETGSSLMAKNVPKGATVTATRLEQNIDASKVAKRSEGQLAKELRASSTRKSSTPLAASGKQAGAKHAGLPPISPAAGSKPLKASGSDASSSFVSSHRSSSSSSAARDKKKHATKVKPGLTRDQLAAIEANKSKGAGGASLVSTVFSFEGDSDDESFSMYSCSCCHVAKQSTVGSGLSDYENMTSVSQRTPNSYASSATTRSSVSRASSNSKLKRLEAELESERRDREKTQKDLQELMRRQEKLLSKLTDKERGMLAKA